VKILCFLLFGSTDGGVRERGVDVALSKWQNLMDMPAFNGHPAGLGTAAMPPQAEHHEKGLQPYGLSAAEACDLFS
jgi:hypothetical protein